MAHVAVWQRTSTLRGALLLKVVIPLVAIMLGFSYLMLWTVERNSERRLQEEVELVARAVRLPLSDSLEKKHERTSQQVLALDPDNEAARQGIESVVQRVVANAESAMYAGNVEQGRAYLRQAKSLNPQAPGIAGHDLL